VGLPDEAGRQQIFRIHTEAMVRNSILGKTVDLAYLAKEAKNYTGAEIEAVVKSAASFSMSRAHNLTDFTKKITIDKEHKVEMQDFEAALAEVKPLFGMDSERLEVYLRRPLTNYGRRFEQIRKVFENAFKQTREGKNTQLTSLLLSGSAGSGTTSLAVHAAHSCGFPFVKLVSP
jgi:vesicle-fusing ATPase